MTLTHSPKLAVGITRCVKRGLGQIGDLGSGSGKVVFMFLNFNKKARLAKRRFLGGGSGGSIRDAGGAFGKIQAGREEEFFKKLEKEQLKSLQMQYRNLRKEMEREIEDHENQVRDHQEAVDRLRRRVDALEKEEQELKSHS
ncbi:unnamed protein product [Thelazia callipaeda]|uniref:ATPase inhibitor, mitochondrial n=1 Tax=Thelazia callipaeda TaxID=103827 RepID=A0A0N5CKK5_THECL|nr:unnamed protein product [Thelazia callipaeda]